MAQLSAEMKGHIEYLIEKQVLVSTQQEVREYDLFDRRFRKTIYVGCPDCDQLKDKMVFHGTRLGEKFHPIAPVHGGASAFHPASLMMPDGAPRIPFDYFVYEIIRAGQIKNTRKVSFYSHAPCAAAHAANFSVPQLVELQLYNRGELDLRLSRDGFPMEVRPYFHVSFGPTSGSEKNKKTFIVSREAWLQVREEFWREHLSRLPCRLTELVAA